MPRSEPDGLRRRDQPARMSDPPEEVFRDDGRPEKDRERDEGAIRSSRENGPARAPDRPGKREGARGFPRAPSRAGSAQ
jgi:hypothetical protein